MEHTDIVSDGESEEMVEDQKENTMYDNLLNILGSARESLASANKRRKRSVPLPNSYDMTILDPFSSHNVAGRVGLKGIRKFKDAFLKGLAIVSAGSEYEELFQTFQ